MIRVALLALAVVLTGCTPTDSDSLEGQIEKLKSENAQLTAQLEQLEAITLAQRAKLDDTVQLYKREVRAAQIAAACDYGPDLCPAALAGPGRALIATGDYYGAAGQLFWLLVGAKFAAFAAPIVLALVLGVWLSRKILAPQRATIELARAEVARAQNSAAEERQAIESAQLEISQWQEAIEEAEEQLDARRASVAEIDARIAARQAEADELDAKVQRLEARRAAMLGRD